MLLLTETIVDGPESAKNSPKSTRHNLGTGQERIPELIMSQKVAVNNDSTYASSSLQNQLTSGLIANGSIPNIQAALLHELQASGWTANMRSYIVQLMRSGECTKYDDLMDKVLEESMKGIMADKDKAKPNGATTNGKLASGDMRIPENAIKEGIKVVKKELEKICEVQSK